MATRSRLQPPARVSGSSRGLLASGAQREEAPPEPLAGTGGASRARSVVAGVRPLLDDAPRPSGPTTNDPRRLREHASGAPGVDGVAGDPEAVNQLDHPDHLRVLLGGHRSHQRLKSSGDALMRSRMAAISRSCRVGSGFPFSSYADQRNAWPHTHASPTWRATMDPCPDGSTVAVEPSGSATLTGCRWRSDGRSRP